MRTSASIDNIVGEFLAEQSIRENSLKTYSRCLDNFYLWVNRNKTNNRELKASDLVEYRNYIMSEYSGKYTSLLLTVLKKYFDWLEEKNYYNNVATRLKLPRYTEQILRDPLSRMDIEMKLLPVIDRSTFKGLRDYLVVLFMVLSGLRCIEVSRIIVGDFIERRNSVGDSFRCMLIQRKGHSTKDDFISVEHFKEIIESYLEQLPRAEDSQPLFYSLSANCKGRQLDSHGVGDIVSGYLTKAGLKSDRVSPHSLRHTAAVELINNGFTIDEIQLFLGHTRSEITKIYTRYANTMIKVENKPGNFLKKHFKI